MLNDGDFVDTTLIYIDTWFLFRRTVPVVKCNTLAYCLGFEGSEETEKPESNNAVFYSE